MLIKPGSSGGAMWMYKDATDRLEAAGLSADQEAVNHTLTALCPPSWAFRDNNGQWGLWPDDLLKYHTHSLLYTSHYYKMVEVLNDIHGC